MVEKVPAVKETLEMREIRIPDKFGNKRVLTSIHHLMTMWLIKKHSNYILDPSIFLEFFMYF
jgi:hypothetical protein